MSPTRVGHADLYRSLNSRGAEYLVVGGIACLLHGVPRTTKDLDLLVRRTAENVERVLAAMQETGLGTATLASVDEVLCHDATIFKDRFRVDILTAIPGVEFEGAWRGRTGFTVAGINVPVLSLADLVRSKEATGRSSDLEDARLLRKIGGFRS